MLTFANAWVFLALPPLLWYFWHSWRRPRPALIYSDLRLLAGWPPGRSRWNKIPPLFQRLAVLLLLLAVANPRWPDRQTRLPAEGIALALVLDLSGSMATPDFGTPPSSRLQAARDSFRWFIEGGTLADGTTLPGRSADQIGLITFAAVPETACPLTHNHSVLLRILAELQPKEGVDAGTNIGDAIAEAVARLEAVRGRNPILILLSDGEHNIHVDRPDRPLMPRESAMLAQALGVTIYAIDCGGTPAETATAEQQKQREDGRKVLEAIAETTGGRVFAAQNPEELAQVLRTLDELETDPRPTFRYRRYHELGLWLALAAFGLYSLGFLLDRVFWRTLPSS